MHSNVQLLYLLLFFAVIVSVAASLNKVHNIFNKNLIYNNHEAEY